MRWAERRYIAGLLGAEILLTILHEVLIEIETLAVYRGELSQCTRHVIVSGDKDLLTVGNYRSILVVTPRDYIDGVLPTEFVLS